MIIYYIFLTLALLSTAFGQVFYKYYFQAGRKVWFLLAVSTFFSAAFFSFLALKKLTIDIVYMSTSITLVMVIILSRLWLNETIHKNKIIGSFLIISGIILYALN